MVDLEGEAVADEEVEFTGQQIAFALQRAEDGTPVVEVCRKMGVSQVAFFRWKKVYGGLSPMVKCCLADLAKAMEREGDVTGD